VVTSTASRPSTHSIVQPRFTAWNGFIVYRRKPNIQEKNLKKWFSSKNLRNMRLVAVKMNRIGYYSSRVELEQIEFGQKMSETERLSIEQSSKDLRLKI
jgi:hypothetical protein